MIKCLICEKNLKGLILSKDGEIKVKPKAKKPSKHYPYCSRCWLKYTEEGVKYNRTKTQRSELKVNGKKHYTLEEVEELAKVLKLRIKEITYTSLWKWEVWDTKKPIAYAKSVHELGVKLSQLL